MRLTNYQKAQEFLEQAQSYLEADEVVNGLMLGIVARLAQFPERIQHPPYLTTVEDKQGLCLCAAITPPFNVILSSNRAITDLDAALRAIAQNLREGKWNPPGVVAESNLAKAFVLIWTKLTGATVHHNVNERIYKLTSVKMPPLPSGHFRQATKEDFELAVSWLQAFYHEATPQEPISDAEGMIRARLADGSLYFWEDGQVVSMAGSSRPTKNGISVGAVYTPPEQRGKGYASACVASLSQYLLDKGYQYCTLFTDLANPTSNSIYQKMGYNPICDFDLYLF